MTTLSRHRRRYRDDPAFRLRKINYNRARLGLPLLGGVEDIGQDLIAFARQRERVKGRFA